MAAEIFCGGMQDQIRAEIERPLDASAPRCCHKRRSRPPRERFRDGGEIDNLEQRIGWRFHPDQFCLRAQRLFHGVQIAHVDEITSSPQRKKISRSNRDVP